MTQKGFERALERFVRLEDECGTAEALRVVLAEELKRAEGARAVYLANYKSLVREQTTLKGKEAPPTEAATLRRADALAVVAAVADHRRLRAETMLGRSRIPVVSRARALTYASLRIRGYSFPAIGAIFRRDHSSVLQVLQAATQHDGWAEDLAAVEAWLAEPARKAA